MDITLKGAYLKDLRVSVNRPDRPEVVTADGPNPIYRCSVEYNGETVVFINGVENSVKVPPFIKDFIGEDGEDFKDRPWSIEEMGLAFTQALLEADDDNKEKNGFSRPKKRTATIAIGTEA
jgi:hypothetical protein